MNTKILSKDKDPMGAAILDYHKTVWPKSGAPD